MTTPRKAALASFVVLSAFVMGQFVFGGGGVRAVPECGASLDAPRSLSAATPEGELEHLRLVSSEGVRVSMYCLPKERSGPQRLEGYARWLVGESFGELDEPFERITFDDVDGHAVLVVEAGVRAGSPFAVQVLFTERARSFLAVEYRTPVATWDAHAPERLALLRSLHVTDPLADVGPTRWWHEPVVTERVTLTEARAAFHTRIARRQPARGFEDAPPPTPPAGVFELVSVPGPAGKLSAYVTPDPKDGTRHPAVIWAHGGFGGIDEWFWAPAPRGNDQSARAFREAGLVLAAGSWRAENDNDGNYELYYGEVDDFLAVRDFVSRLPYVDPDRIYLAGHSSGGTLVLLAAEKDERFRAAFSIGGSPQLGAPEGYERFGGVPFPPHSEQEQRLRSAAGFYKSIRKPTFYFEGSDSAGGGAAQWMADEAARERVPFEAYLALQADHFSILAPLTELLARKILADTGLKSSIHFTQAEVDALVVEPIDD